MRNAASCPFQTFDCHMAKYSPATTMKPKNQRPKPTVNPHTAQTFTRLKTSADVPTICTIRPEFLPAQPLLNSSARPYDVRFTPESGHWLSVSRCPLCANSRHQRRLWLTPERCRSIAPKPLYAAEGRAHENRDDGNRWRRRLLRCTARSRR